MILCCKVRAPHTVPWGLFGLLFVLSSPAAAAITALVGPFASGVFRFDDSVVGWEFRTGPRPLRIEALGVNDATFTGPQPDASLAFSHVVGIFARDTQALVGQATVPAGHAARLEAGFRYAPVSFTLSAQTDYVIAATWPGLPLSDDFSTDRVDGFVFFTRDSVLIGSPDLRLPARGGAREQRFASELVFPQARYDELQGIVGPNFQFKVLAIPQVSVLEYVVLGLLIAWMLT